MKIVAILHSTEYRGDHSAMVTTVFTPAEGETVAALVERAMATPRCTYRNREHDWLELREVQS